MAPPRTRAAQGRHGGDIPSDFSTQKNTRARALAFRAEDTAGSRLHKHLVFPVEPSLGGRSC